MKRILERLLNASPHIAVKVHDENAAALVVNLRKLGYFNTELDLPLEIAAARKQFYKVKGSLDGINSGQVDIYADMGKYLTDRLAHPESGPGIPALVGKCEESLANMRQAARRVIAHANKEPKTPPEWNR